MRRSFVAIFLGLLVVLPLAADEDRPRVRFVTTHGDFVIELLPSRTPATVENFLRYVRADFYDGSIFHRVIPEFVIQGGGFTPHFDRLPVRAPIRNEAHEGPRNLRGTLSMARTPDPHSATSQFFINLADNPALDHRAKTERGWGYAVFGRVVEGMDTVERIADVETASRGAYRDVPVEPVIVRDAAVIDKPENTG